ncbi:MAG: hypothetical protein KIS86_00640 [Devosia sp.]|nr:hypothetical protein [Devosia sp.]
MLSEQVPSAGVTDTDPVAQRHLRAMTSADLPHIERLFFDVFRAGGQNRAGFSQYFRRLFLEGPNVGGGLVSDDDQNRIAAAFAYLPVRYKIYDQTVTAKLACSFMSDRRSPMAAARLVMSMRSRTQDLVFTDSVSHAGVGHLMAAGAAVLPVQSLDWICRFKPVSALARRARLPALFDGAAGLADRVVTRLRPRPVPEARLAITETDLHAFAEAVPLMLAQFAVRPDWTDAELRWLLGLASENTALGQLRFFAFHDRSGERVGCLAAYFDGRKRVRVLDVMALPGNENHVVETMLAFLRGLGTSEAFGPSHPHLLLALAPHRGVMFRHRSFTCVLTRFDQVKKSIHHNEIYMGGLAGESWSRLMTDFF